MAHSDRYLLFIEYFNKGKYFSAQTILDEIWLDETGSDKNFYGGLIQVAVSLFQLTQEKNPKGALKIYGKAKEMLDPYGERHLGLSIGKFVNEMNGFFSESVRPDDPATYSISPPKIEFDPA